MTKGAYYNEIDPFAAAWLRELIKGKHIADGEVDERSIEDVCPDDLAAFTETGEHGSGFTVDGCMPERFEYAGPSMGSRQPGPTNGFWRDPDWLFCRDGKWRPVESGSFPLAHAGAFRNRVGLLRGAGNAINLAQAQGFVEAVMESL